jgi:two-component system LytT family sensor kinase
VLPREEGGSITVKITRNNGTLQICVADDGPGLSKEAAPISGALGLSNTAARLNELYGDKSSLSLGTSSKGGAAAVIEIPFRTAGPRSLHEAC